MTLRLRQGSAFLREESVETPSLGVESRRSSFSRQCCCGGTDTTRVVVWGEGDVRRWDYYTDKPATRTFAAWVGENVMGQLPSPSPSAIMEFL
ncbi:hypothetical protein CDL15_Pgr017519 [Punica granatum]|uniref:Uncharacterized protein n=1 Tax=Punica granatum TaxID=22663 RepID=A0A218W6U1_PUNGR|nr:hypothetical protein CDL15_Pgr017519 [Punica granatum]